MAFCWIHRTNFWPKVNKGYLLDLSEWSLWTNWDHILVKKRTLEWFRFGALAASFSCASAERCRLLLLLTRFSSKWVWLKVARISMRQVQHQSRLCESHLCQKVSTFSVGRKSTTGGWEKLVVTRLGLRVSHLAVIRLAACSFIPFLHHKVSLSARTDSDFITANPWQRRNKPHKDEFDLRILFYLQICSLWPALRLAFEKQMAISERNNLPHA